MNTEIKKIVNRVKDAQEQLQALIKSHDWLEEARQYAERQGKEVKKLFAPFTPDVDMMKNFLERERKEMERFQKKIPGELKKIRKFINLQKKEFEKLLANLRKMHQGNKAQASMKKEKSKKVVRTVNVRKKGSSSHKNPASAATE